VPEHIPGAVHLNTETVRFSKGGIPARLFFPARIANIIGGLGIGNDHTVVIYSSGEEAFAHAAYVAYLLEWIGRSALGGLDGGFEKWKKAAR
jgi:thiosulfate/3-mercaptopyruvate sulfurtransferase